ncbi:unnamed protein product [marine sediment metagenome]|uniref:Uncharacterized protein n=1 Tax=marine sediment metagenome TaxID=412755 RepID=X0TNQ9_9ZZZZ
MSKESKDKTANPDTQSTSDFEDCKHCPFTCERKRRKQAALNGEDK